MIISDTDKNDNEYKEYLDRFVKDGDLYKYNTTVKGLIYAYYNVGNYVVSYPSNTINILKKLDGNKKCTVYKNIKDGCGCIYIDIMAIIIED